MATCIESKLAVFVIGSERGYTHCDDCFATPLQPLQTGERRCLFPRVRSRTSELQNAAKGPLGAVLDMDNPTDEGRNLIIFVLKWGSDKYCFVLAGCDRQKFRMIV